MIFHESETVELKEIVVDDIKRSLLSPTVKAESSTLAYRTMEL